VTPEEVRRHYVHLCEVWDGAGPTDRRVSGVIFQCRDGRAYVAGHADSPTGWVPYGRLATSCQIKG
jgi:hypothetical protein